MLQEVIDLQNEAVSKLFACVKSKKEVTLKAPTGSGKLVLNIMNKYLYISI